MEPEEIYSIFYEKDNRSKMNSPDEFIHTYEANKEQIESIENHFYERIKIEYAITLGYNEEYKRALPLLKKNIELMSEPNFDNPLMVTESYLKSSRFVQGQSFYYTKKLNQAKALFSELHKEYPNNDIYKNWAKNSIHWKFQNIIRPLWIFAGVCLFLHLIIDLLYGFNYLSTVILALGIIAMLTILLFHLFSKYQQIRFE